MDGRKTISRRRVLAAGTAGIVAAALPTAGQTPEQAARPTVPADPTKVQGPTGTDVGARSPFEKPKRLSLTDRRTATLTPLQDLDGIITPSDLHFERHHGGVPAIGNAAPTIPAVPAARICRREMDFGRSISPPRLNFAEGITTP